LLGSGYDHIDLMAAAFGADEPGAPIEHRRFGAVPLGHLGGIGLDLVAAILAPNDQPDAGSGGATQRHRRAGRRQRFGKGGAGANEILALFYFMMEFSQGFAGHMPGRRICPPRSASGVSLS
jgi:hypothetical protein